MDIDLFDVPSILDCKDNPKYYHGKRCKCGDNLRYKCNRYCVTCTKKESTQRIQNYQLNDTDKAIAIDCYNSDMSIQDIRVKLGCLANHVREYLGLPLWGKKPKQST